MHAYVHAYVQIHGSTSVSKIQQYVQPVINTILTVYNTTNIVQTSITDHLYAHKTQLHSKQ